MLTNQFGRIFPKHLLKRAIGINAQPEQDEDSDAKPDSVQDDKARFNKTHEAIKQKMDERTLDIRSKTGLTAGKKSFTQMSQGFTQKFKLNSSNIMKKMNTKVTLNLPHGRGLIAVKQYNKLKGKNYIAKAFGDADGDKLANILDCAPLNRDRQGVVHDFLGRLSGYDPRQEELRKQVGKETADAERRKLVKAQVRKDVRAALQPKAQIFTRKPQSVQAHQALFSNYSSKILSYSPELKMSSLDEARYKQDIPFKTGVYLQPKLKKSKEEKLQSITGISKETMGPFTGLNKERNRLKAKGIL